MTIIHLDGRRGLVAAMDTWERRFNAAVDETVKAGLPLDAEQITDELMIVYCEDTGPEIVRSLARKTIGDLVRAAIEKRGRP